MLLSQDYEADGDGFKTGSLIWKLDEIDVVQSEMGGAKNIKCKFCDSAFTGCSPF